jgi:hypothetical protein
MRGIGDYFVKLFLASIGLIMALITLIYAISIKQEGAAWLATVSLLSGILLVVLSVQEIRIILNLVFNQSIAASVHGKSVVETKSSSGESQDIKLETPFFHMDHSIDFADTKIDFSSDKTVQAGNAVELAVEVRNQEVESTSAIEESQVNKFDILESGVSAEPERTALQLTTTQFSDALKSAESLKSNDKENTRIQSQRVNSDYCQFFEVVKKSKTDHAFGQLEVIDDIYRKMKHHLAGERGLIISGTSQLRGPCAVTLRQIIKGEKGLEQLICKNIYPDLDLLPDTELNFVADRKYIENTLISLWADYYRVVILVEEWEEEFWRAVARNVNERVSIGRSQEWLTVPAIKRKRPISYQNLSRFEIFNN